jgi:hypothetical protein
LVGLGVISTELSDESLRSLSASSASTLLSLVKIDDDFSAYFCDCADTILGYWIPGCEELSE